MSQIIVYYKGEPADFGYILKACNVFNKRNLIVDKKV